MTKTTGRVEWSSGGWWRALRPAAVGVVGVLTLLNALAGPGVAESATPGPASPVSVSLLPSGDGWMLSNYRCGVETCIGVEHTSNAGVTWNSAAIPISLQHVTRTGSANYFSLAQLTIYFANAEDGWIYGSVPSGSPNGTTHAELWSTHDAGRRWFPVSMTSLGVKYDILSVGAAHGEVYAIGWNSGQSFGLWRSPLAADSWHRVRTPRLDSAAGGSGMEGALVFRGASGWLLVGNDRGVTGSARLTSSNHWVEWNSPCAKVGGDFAVPVAYSPTSLVDACTIGGFGGDVAPDTPRVLKMAANWIFTSHDGGLTFAASRQIDVGGPTTWLNQVPGLPGSPSPGVIFVAKFISKGQTSIEHLFVTRNGGRTWTSAYTMDSESAFLTFVTFASPTLAAAIVQTTPSTSLLLVSTDGGRTWRRTRP